MYVDVATSFGFCQGAKTSQLCTDAVTYCNILTYVSFINTWASGDSPLAQLVKELDLCLFLCVMRRL